LEDNNVILNDEAEKIVLNTKGIMKDLSDDLLEFLDYIENSTDDKVKYVKGKLVKTIHKRVQEVKNDVSMEVEFMTLLERDREKIEEGIEEGILLTKKVLKLSNSGYTISQIAKECNISEEEVKRILE
jgi:DNA-binding NarL/FixJ family response regulator